MRGLTAALAISLSSFAAPAAAQVMVPAPSVITMPLARIGTARHTRFDPAVHGFRFANTFAVNLMPEVDVRTDGLCGGMAYAALDYFNMKMAIPTQDWEPTEGSKLRQFLDQRQKDSVYSNIDKWGELSVNPFGARNSEFYQWGIQLQPGSRIDELRQEIDAGRPVPLGLKGCNEGCKGDHQVVAIGYDMGGYDGRPETVRQFKIFIYDPNHPGQKMVLVAYPEAQQFRYANATGERWRSWFVNRNHRPVMPPTISEASNQLILELLTGGDDLRGGNDNVHAIVLLRSGRELRFENVNLLKRWVNNSWHTIALPLPPEVTGEQIRGVRLETSFGGGIGGDNWNLDAIRAQLQSGDSRINFEPQSGAPLFRFTGDARKQDFIFPDS